MSDDEAAIRELIATWHRATAARDVATVLGLMAEDVVFLVAGQPPLRGQRLFEHGLRNLLATHRVEATGAVQEVQVVGDLAYAWTELEVRMTKLVGGALNVRTGAALSILRKQPDGKWLLVRDANLLA